MQLRSPGALAEAMKYSGHTVTTLAQAVGANRSTVGHLRSGIRTNCADGVAHRIAEAVDLPLDFLFVVPSANDTHVESDAA